jgi:hypothetical protein
MTTAVWIALGIAVLFGVGYVLRVRMLIKESGELDKKIDYSKVRPWKDDD